MQTCENASLSLRFGSDFLVSTKCKIIIAVASFRNSSAQFLSLRGVLTSVSCPRVLLTCSYTSQLHETVLRECLTFLFFRRSCCSSRWLFLKRICRKCSKMDSRKFMKRKRISDSRSVEKISDKRLRIEVQPPQTNGVERVKRFVNVHLHCIVSNLQRIIKISTFPPDEYTDFDLEELSVYCLYTKRSNQKAPQFDAWWTA